VLALDPAASEFYRDGAYHLAGEGQDPRCCRPRSAIGRNLVRRYPDRVDRGRNGPRMTGTAGLSLRARAGRLGPARRRRFVRHQPAAAARRKRTRCRQRACSSRSIRSALCQRRLKAVEIAQRGGLGRGFFFRIVSGETEDTTIARSGGRDQLRSDQDGIAVALGPARQIQPADPHRRAAQRFGAVSRPFRVAGITQSGEHLLRDQFATV